MTALAADAGSTGATPGATAPEDRGGLTIADRVVERVAGYAATQVDGAAAAPRRLLAWWRRSRSRRSPAHRRVV